MNIIETIEFGIVLARLKCNKLIDNIWGEWILWLIPTASTVFSFYLLFFLSMRSLSIWYLFISIVLALIAVAMYAASYIKSEDATKNDPFISSSVFFILFTPIISGVVLKLPFVSRLFGTMKNVWKYLIILTFFGIVFGSCISADSSNIGDKISPKSFQGLNNCTLSNGLMMILGFLSFGYYVLSWMKNPAPKVFIVGRWILCILSIYTIAMTFILWANTASMTNCWTKKETEVRPALQKRKKQLQKKMRDPDGRMMFSVEPSHSHHSTDFIRRN